MTSVAIVEDEDSIALALRVLMEREGHEAVRYRDGAAAVEALAGDEGAAPDLLLIDVHLPGLSGFSVCEALRERPHLSGAAILLMSAGAGRHAEERALAAGADGYLPKPFDAKELVALSRRLLSSRAGGAPAHG